MNSDWKKLALFPSGYPETFGLMTMIATAKETFGLMTMIATAKETTYV
jgi:hypothetical protein